MPTILLPNGQEAEFPEDMPLHEIKSIVQKKFPSNNVVNSSIEKEEDPRVNTFIGSMPRKIAEFQSGTPENKKLLEELIGIGAGMPGINLVSKGIVKGAKLVPEIVSKGYGNLKNTISSAVKNRTLHEKLSKEAGNEYELAEKLSAPVSPGLYKSPSSELENIENEIGRYINIEADHGTRISPLINNRVNSIEGFWSDAFKRLEKKITDNKFIMPEKALEHMDFDKGKIIETIKKGNWSDFRKIPKELKNDNPFLKELMESSPTSLDRNAGDFLSKARDFRDLLGGLKQDIKSEKYGSFEKKKISEAIQKGKEVEKHIKNTLSEGLGEFKPEYDWVMKGYSEQVFPLRKNPLVKSSKKGKMSENIIKDLRTNEPGMELLRDIVKQDPEIVRNLIGQVYLKKPSSLHSPNETLREYLSEVPELKGLLNQKEKALEKAASRKDISLKEKIRTEKELQAIKDARKKLLISAAGFSVAVPGIKKASQLFTND